MDIFGLGLFAAIGAITGSFLTVVIGRGPALWGLTDPDAETSAGDMPNLVRPRSFCPACQRQLRVLDLVPLLGYLRQRGRCRECGSAIPAIYPVTEFSMVAAGIACALVFPGWFSAALGLFFFSMLFALSAIDLRTGYLPDALTFPLMWIGVAMAFVPGGQSPDGALVGLAAGGGSFWLLGELYRRVRGREGLGGGDTKLFAGGGAFVGALALPLVAIIASVAGLVYVIVSSRRPEPASELRFGPFLAIGFAIVYLAAATGALPSLAPLIDPALSPW